MGGKSRKVGATSKMLIERIKNRIPTGKKQPVKKEKKEGLLTE